MKAAKKPFHAQIPSSTPYFLLPQQKATVLFSGDGKGNISEYGRESTVTREILLQTNGEQVHVRFLNVSVLSPVQLKKDLLPFTQKIKSTLFN